MNQFKPPQDETTQKGSDEPAYLRRLRETPLEHWTRNDTERGLISRPPSTELALYAGLRDGLNWYQTVDEERWCGFELIELDRAYLNLRRWGMIVEVRAKQGPGGTPLVGHHFPRPQELEHVWDLTEQFWCGSIGPPECSSNWPWPLLLKESK